jgi:hypothetical protein
MAVGITLLRHSCCELDLRPGMGYAAGLAGHLWISCLPGFSGGLRFLDMSIRPPLPCHRHGLWVTLSYTRPTRRPGIFPVSSQWRLPLLG